MQNAGLDEAQAGIKIAGWSISNFIYIELLNEFSKFIKQDIKLHKIITFLYSNNE